MQSVAIPHRSSPPAGERPCRPHTAGHWILTPILYAFRFGLGTVILLFHQDVDSYQIACVPGTYIVGFPLKLARRDNGGLLRVIIQVSSYQLELRANV